MSAVEHELYNSPLIVPLGDEALLVRFASTLSDTANRAAIAFAQRLATTKVIGIFEVVANLVSVIVRYDPALIDSLRLQGELALVISASEQLETLGEPVTHIVDVRFLDEANPEFIAIASAMNLSPSQFISAHNAHPIRVLTTGFAPGFVYCGFHPIELNIPRRSKIQSAVPPGTVLFAAGQTAITATTIPTGWHIIGKTEFSNFNAAANPPTTLRAGDMIQFRSVR